MKKVLRPHSVAILALGLAQGILSSARAEGELKSWLGSAFTVPGEETELWLMVLSETRPAAPSIPPVQNLGIKLLDDHVLAQRSRQNLYLYQYSILSYTKGTHTIPPFEMKVDGQTVRSQPIDLHVAELPENAWADHRLAGEEFRFAGAIFVPQRVPHEGETIPTEAKIYLPARVSIADASIAEVEHDGVAAWRFEAVRVPIPRPYASRVFSSKVRLDGLDYVGLCYRSTATAIRTGEISVGPGTARLTIGTQISSRGLSVRQNIATQLPLPKRTFQAWDLPSGAPPGFEMAVGRFQISAQADTAGLEEGDPISVRLSVSGIGNLDTLKPPRLDAEESEWKVYEPSRLVRAEERRDVSGVVTFSQIIRPLGSQREIPSFRLVSFNPQSGEYETITTPPIPFHATAARRASGPPAAVLPDLNTPVEEMESILGIIDSPRASAPRSPAFWWRYWHVVPATFTILLLALIARRHLLPRLGGPSHEKEVQAALHRVEQAGPSSRDFLRASGQFIERWIPGPERDEEVASLLERRDTQAYRPDAAEETMAAEERTRIISRLRSKALAAVSLLGFAAILLLGGQARAAAFAPEVLYRQAEAAWTEGSYRSALSFYESAHPDGNFPADVLYNVANCYFQLGEPGLASLHYHRALEVDPTHAESRQNLRFLKRKTGAITVVRPKFQEQIGRIDRSVFGNLLFLGGWLVVLAILGLLAPLSKGLRVVAWTGAAAGPVVAFAGAMGVLFYPSGLDFAPPSERAIVVSKESIKARTEASQSSSEVITVPPGSLCRPLARRGPWTYVELANETRGWLPSELVRTVDPKAEPSPAPPVDLGA